MKVKCPNCNSEGNIPDDKISDAGINVSCPNCKEKFSVKKELSQGFTVEKEIPPVKQIFCPNCGTEQPSSVSCIKCGIVFDKFFNKRTNEPDKKEKDVPSSASQKRTPETKKESNKKEIVKKKGSDEKFCTECGNEMNLKAEICPACGVRAIASPKNGISKVVLLLITFFLGGIGGHKFYQKKYGLGILYLLFCVTGIPSIVALIEFLIYCFKSEEELQQNYPEYSVKALVIAIVLSIAGTTVVGILAAIAIPQFSSYRIKAYNSSAMSDLRNCKTQAEAYYADYQTYPMQSNQMTCASADGVAVYYLALSADKYQIISYHENGDKSYIARSDNSEITKNTKDEIISQITTNFGSDAVGESFHFIE